MSRCCDHCPPTPGVIQLWHPESPGVRIWIRPGLLRRLGLRDPQFATLGEALRYHRDRLEDAVMTAGTEVTS